VASIASRIVRNPHKYLRRSFWVPTLKEFAFRGSAGLLFAAPTIVHRALRRKRTMRIYVFPSPLDRYQLAETYVAWKVFWNCNLEVTTSDPDSADIAIAWHPSTNYTPDESLLRSLEARMPVLNARCTDIRKSVVDRIFAEVAGYSLDVDPHTYRGTMLRKSENNGTHDARLLEGPLNEAEPGYVYQRLVSYESLYGYAEWRTFIVGRKPVETYVSYRPLDDRFRTLPSLSGLARLDETFTAKEQQIITAFCERMKLDFGVLDILRDAQDGRMYISDCNNTPTGPSATTLSARSQMRVVRDVAVAFEREYLLPLGNKRPRNL